MMQYVVGGTVLTYVGTTVLNSLVSGVLETLYSSASFVKNGTDSNKIIQQVKMDMDILDIPLKLQLVKTLIDKSNLASEQNNEQHEQSAMKQSTMKQSHLNKNTDDIKLIIENGLVDLICKIKSTLEWIDFEIIKHKEKWFSGYRSISFDNKIKELQNLITILDNRIALLMNFNKI